MDEVSSHDAAPETHPDPAGPPAPQTPRPLIVTPVLVAANVLYFLVMVSAGVSVTAPSIAEALAFGANFGAATTSGEWWRLLTSTFVHHGILHLGLNMWCLWVLGNIAERMFGSARFLAIYIVSGLGGSVASLLSSPWGVSAGASGAVFGTAGALAAFIYLARVKLPPQVSRGLFSSLIIFIGFNLAFGAAIPAVDNAGHLGGLVAGALLGAALRFGSIFYAGVAATSLGLAALCPLAVPRVADEPRVQMTEAVLLIHEGDEAGAITKLEETLARAPDFAEAQHMLTALYLQERRYDDAVRAARRSVELDPQSERIQAVLVQALFLAGDYEAVVDESTIAIQLDPNDLQTRGTLSRALLELDRKEDAVAALEEAVEWAPDSAFPFLELGWIHFKIDDLDASVSSLEKAIELEPENPEGYNRLSLVLARSGAREESLTAIEKALELNPTGAHLLDSLGTVRFYRGELDQAVAAYQQAIDLDQERGVYFYNLSLALEKRGSSVASESARTKAFRLEPNLAPPNDGAPMM